MGKINCKLCENMICKYTLDFRSCGGHYVALPHKKPEKQVIEYIEICHDCLKVIMEEGVDSL